MTDLATTITVLDACGRARVPALLISEPGMGKSSLIRSLAASNQMLCETVLGSIREPADFAGLPVVTDDGVRLEAPAWAKRLVEAGCGYLFMDELTTVPGSVQAAMLAVALDRTVGDLRLPWDVRMVAGANPPDSAADGHELSAPLANRFLHVTFAPSVDEWLTGSASGWGAPPASRAVAADKMRREARAALVRGFIHVRPDLLDAGPSNLADAGSPWPSRRTWTMLGDVLAHVRDDDPATTQAVAFGLVGEGAAIEFLEWWAKADLPLPEDVIADPASFDWDSSPDRVWAVLSAVAGWAAARGTVAAWRDAWKPVMAAADVAPDVAAAAARMLGRSRPASASVPATVKKFTPILQAAGLIEDAA